MLGWIRHMFTRDHPTDPDLPAIQEEAAATRRDVVDRLASRGVALEFNYADRIAMGLPERRKHPRRVGR